MHANDTGCRGRRKRRQARDVGKCLTRCIKDCFDMVIISANAIIDLINRGYWHTDISHKLVDVIPVSHI
jgi:hypothetical protein